MSIKDYGREIIAGISTFATMSYIIFVQPAVLGGIGMDFEGVLLATCITSAIATILLGFFSNLPIAIAPAMGHNFFFATVLCVMLGLGWREALTANLVSGALFLFVTFIGLSEFITRSVPQSLKASISVGIGLLISFIGLQWGGLIVASKGTLVKLGNLEGAPAIATFIGLAVGAILYALGVRFSIIFGIAASSLFLWSKGFISLEGFISIPHLTTTTTLKFDFSSLFRREFLDVLVIIFAFFFLDLFDTAGTFIGLVEVGGFQPDKKTTSRVFLADALGTILGTALGTSTVTSYVESAVGIQAGGRTKTVCFTVALLFIASLFLLPLIKVIGGSIEFNGARVYPTISCALIFVGLFMMRPILSIRWDDITEALPAFLTILSMAFSLSITDGISFGFISYTVLKVLTGKLKELNPVIVIFSLLFVARYIFIKF
jgi:AGZA family xanthine/uracil permease-like MFS transporter